MKRAFRLPNDARLGLESEGAALHVAPDLRRELKFVLPALPSELAVSRIRARLPNLVAEYPRRRVSSIYFDSATYHSYMQSNSGMSARVKLRMRWYGEAMEVAPVLELKNRLSHVGWKRQHQLRLLDLADVSFDDLRATFRREVSQTERTTIDMLHRPIVIVSYERHYFRTVDRKLRVTIDSGLRFFDQRNRPWPNFVFDRRDAAFTIVECKGSADDLVGATNALAALGARQSRFSKYCYGVGLLSRR